MSKAQGNRVSRTVDISIYLDRQSATPLYSQIYQQIQHAIKHAIVVEGQKLPSIRRLAQELAVSHITVEKAYLQLNAEGYVCTAPRSGYVVNKIDTDYFTHSSPNNDVVIDEIMQGWKNTTYLNDGYSTDHIRYDFAYHQLTPGSFPHKIWTKLTSEVLQSNPRLMSEYSFAPEASSLQRSLARYLGRTRGVQCLPEQIVICAGSEAALTTVLNLFDNRQHSIAHEEPGWRPLINIARNRRFEIAPLPVCKSPERYLKALDAIDPKLVFATPSNQFPTSQVAPLHMRVELLKRAYERNFYIIEDDACSEYRYDTGLIPSLQSLDAYNRVVYMNNFSKTLSPALRVAYIILPPKLLRRYASVSSTPFSHVSTLTQEVLARFIDEGYYDQHIRRMSSLLRQRRDALLEALNTIMGDRIRISGGQSGMHIMLEADNAMTQDELTVRAAQRGVRIYKTTGCWLSRPSAYAPVMIGFSCIDVRDIEPAVLELKRAWFS